MRHALRRLRTRWDDEDGLSLVEILIAVFVLSVAILALASTAGASLQSLRVSRDRQNATQFATTVLEEARALTFASVVLDTADAPPDTFNGETVVKAAGGAIDHIRTEGRLTATTYVTFVPGTADKQKRVLVDVRWTELGRTRTVRQETLVVEATRGLDAPSFKLTQPSPSSGTPGETICFNHTLSNTGDVDGYSWKLFATDSTTGALVEGIQQVRTVREPGTSPDPSVDGFRVPAGAEGSGWFAWARMDTPVGAPLERMTDTTGDGRPDSATRVPALSSASLVICYTPLNTSGILTGQTKSDGTATFTPRVYSAFDETVTTQSQGNEITNTVQVVPANTVYYLHHDPALYPNFLMNTTPPPTTNLPADYDGDGVPGLGLSEASEETVSWSHQFDSSSTSFNLTGTPTLRFWVRTPTAPPLDAEGNEVPHVLELDLKLERISAGNTTTLSDVELQVTPVSVDWQEVTVALPVAASVDFVPTDFIRVVVRCDDDSTTDCHIDYDVNDASGSGTVHDSRLQVTIN